MGEPRWVPVAQALLRRAGMECEAVRPRGRFALLRWALGGGANRFDAIHHLTGPAHPKRSVPLLATRKPVIWHWIGSDLLAYRARRGHGISGRLNDWAAHSPRALHLADSPELAAELAAVGIAARVSRLLPEKIEAQIAPLPERFSVLSYWSDTRWQFYGGPIILKLAESFPDVPFRIAGATGQGITAPPNVEFLGPCEDMESVYRASSVLIRLPEHDSLSAMVLEAMARGRFVIYNKQLEGGHFAQGFEEAQAALCQIMNATGPNTSGAAAVKTHFSLDREAAMLADLYAGLHNDRKS